MRTGREAFLLNAESDSRVDVDGRFNPAAADQRPGSSQHTDVARFARDRLRPEAAEQESWTRNRLSRGQGDLGVQRTQERAGAP